MYTDTLTLLKDTSYSAFFLKKKTKQNRKRKKMQLEQLRNTSASNEVLQ